MSYSPDTTYPYFFAWVDPGQPFTPHEHRVDEDIVDFDLEHDEGQLPTLEITIRNPRIGLLSPGRKVWAWFAYQDPITEHVYPLFYGVLVAVPTNIFAEKVTLKFIARPQDYIEKKQAVAETLKIRPYWDPVFLDEKRRDEPDAILEGWSALYHVDRTSHVVSASDILEGEDGNIVFTQDDAIYSSLGVTIGQAPLNTVQVQASVKWTQRTTGFVTGPPVNVITYTGDTFMGDWPKPGRSLGGGWRCEDSFVDDVYMVALTPTAHESTSWSSKAKDLADCATNSMSQSSSFPALLSPDSLNALMTEQSQTGECDPGDSLSVLGGSDPVNRPSSVHFTGLVVPKWFLNCTWNLRYDAHREFTEFMFFNVNANAQAVLTSPAIEQHTEVLTLHGSDVGEPLQEFDAWSDFAGLSVPLAQIIFPNDPTLPGGTSYQICVTAGTASTDEPNFSDVPGTVTVDGTVHWASLGESPLTNQPNWSDSTPVPVGEIIYNVPKYFNIESGDWEDAAGGYYLLCTGAGETNSAFQEFSYVPPVHDNDAQTPEPIRVSFIPGPGWTWPGHATGTFLGTDNLIWTPIDPTKILAIPIGGNPVNVTGRCYFPTDRGLWSTEYLICKARARIRLRARAVKVKWACGISLMLGMSCRHSATIHDPRLPGGMATGKIIHYCIKGSGGHVRGEVEIGCSVGYAHTVAEDDGTPEYTNTDEYMALGYQVYDDGTALVGVGDIGYTPPIFSAFDDGLSFPLRSLPVQGDPSGTFSGSAAAQKAAIEAAFPATQALAGVEASFSQTRTAEAKDQTVSTSGDTPQGAWWLTNLMRAYTAFTVPYVMEANPVTWQLFIKPVTNGPFNGAYGLKLTLLELPQGINLEAPSSP